MELKSKEADIAAIFDKGLQAHNAGDLSAAEQLYQETLAIRPEHPEANHNIGVVLVTKNELDKALTFFKFALDNSPNVSLFWASYIDTLIKLERIIEAKALIKELRSSGLCCKNIEAISRRLDIETQEPLPKDTCEIDEFITQQKFDDAIGACLDLLETYPSSAILNITLGRCYFELGRIDLAISSYAKATEYWPQSEFSYAMLGQIYSSQGDTEQAIKNLNKVVELRPDYHRPHSLLGMELTQNGDFGAAIESFGRALKLKPDCAEAYYNMGIALQGQGKLGESIEAYNQVLAIKPDCAEAYYNMGIALQGQGKLGESIEAYSQALTIRPQFDEAYYNIGNVLTEVVFKKSNPGLQKTITVLLDKKSYVRPSDISEAAISLLKFEPKLKKYLQILSADEVKPSPQELAADLSELNLLLKLMSVCPLPDLELEKLFTDLRASLLLSISDLTGSPEELKFQSALALQCFTNEYIYIQSKNEEKAIALLEGSVKQALSNEDQPSPQSILCLASYTPLNQYEWSSSLLVTNEIQEVLTRQITEPNQEANFKTILPVLEKITNKVSSKVRKQYEASPYPRWVDLGLCLKPTAISKVVDKRKIKLFDNKINDVEAPNILIAGCGTGQHSIGTGTRFKGSKVLAIDLSLSSLGYAKRKTEELGIQNIDYMQADILDLGKLGRQFDIVESVGVLHHMDDPFAGWRVLTDCLKSGGLMRIGLYSKLARQLIVQIRKEISNAGIGLSNEAIKSFRTMMINSNQKHHKAILNSPDFYSLSELKDLLFHVQEHRFTIPRIKEYLSESGLKFCGFESEKIVSHFKLINAGADDPFDLDKWQAYEEVNPSTFSEMYQFWCQKID
jgi:tetratricopeptide (TPR) repeat protein